MADFEDDLLAGAFAEFREEARTYVRPAGVAAAHAAVRTRKRKHAVVASVLAALFVVGPVTAYVTINGDSHGPPGVVGESGSPTPEAPTPTPTLSSTPTPTAPAAPDGRISRSVLDKATLDIPDWGPHRTLEDCSSGAVKFSGGGHRIRDSVSVRIEDVAYVDVDDDGAQETVVRFSCGDQDADFQVAAFDRDAAGRIRTLGQVVAQAGPVRVIPDLRAGADGSVEVRVGDIHSDLRGPTPPPYIQFQWRSYGWNGTGFVQTGGPRSFPVNPRVTDFSAASSDLVFGPATDGLRRGSLTVTVRNLGKSSLPYTLTVNLPLGLGVVKQARCVSESYPQSLDVTCDQPELAPGGRRVVTIEFTAQVPVTPDALLHAVVRLKEGYADSEYDNNRAQFNLRF